MKTVMHIVGARPNFMKMAPAHAALAARGVPQSIVHTGQHYDAAMSDIFFRELGVPDPDYNLNVGSGSHAQQTGEIMMRLEPLLIDHKPDWVVVYGDVNSTVAASIVAVKLRLRVAHVEAGLRSRDRSMPEEINRLLTDQISDLLFTPSEDGNVNLAAEGIPPERIRFVGNVMVDTLLKMLPAASERLPVLRNRFGVGRFAVLTLHRPSNVDDEATLRRLLDTLADLSRQLPLIFPIHPRTRGALSDLIGSLPDSLILAEPLGYLDFLALQSGATVVITDSGGVQEETTVLGVPCLTIRPNTERPVTITLGTNKLVAADSQLLRFEFERALAGQGKKGTRPPLWDGLAAERIADVLTESE